MRLVCSVIIAKQRLSVRVGGKETGKASVVHGRTADG